MRMCALETKTKTLITSSGPTSIIISPVPVIEAIEGSDIQFYCSPFHNIAPLILEINGTEVDPSLEPRLSAVGYDADNITYSYTSVLFSEDGITFQCFTPDRVIFSEVTRLSILCEDNQMQY